MLATYRFMLTNCCFANAYKYAEKLYCSAQHEKGNSQLKCCHNLEQLVHLPYRNSLSAALGISKGNKNRAKSLKCGVNEANKRGDSNWT